MLTDEEKVYYVENPHGDALAQDGPAVVLFRACVVWGKKEICKSLEDTYRLNNPRLHVL